MTPRARIAALTNLDDLDRAIVNRLQEGIALTPHPFAAIAEELGTSEHDLLARVRRLCAANVLTRFGPFFDAAALGGAFCLCAMAVPPDRFDDVAEAVNAFDEVAHNYEREHTLNMWFVLATETPAGIDAAAHAIEGATGICVHKFPKLEEFFIGFRVAA